MVITPSIILTIGATTITTTSAIITIITSGLPTITTRVIRATHLAITATTARAAMDPTVTRDARATTLDKVPLIADRDAQPHIAHRAMAKCTETAA